MVTLSCRSANPRRRRGSLSVELVVAMGIVAGVLLPLGGAWFHELRMLRTHYHNAVAMELLDGETEVLAAGGWRRFPEGRHEWKPDGAAATNLPPGRFVLQREPGRLVLEWRPERGRVQTREVRLP